MEKGDRNFINKIENLQCEEEAGAVSKISYSRLGKYTNDNTRYNALIEETKVATVYEVSSAGTHQCFSEPIEYGS